MILAGSSLVGPVRVTLRIATAVAAGMLGMVHIVTSRPVTGVGLAIDVMLLSIAVGYAAMIRRERGQKRFLAHSAALDT